MSTEFTINEGSDIGSPRDDDSEGILAEMERKALAEAIDIEQSAGQQAASAAALAGQEEAGRTAAAGRAGDPSGTEAGVYGDLASEAMGGSIVQLAKTGMDMIRDQDPGSFSIGGKKVKTFEDLIKGSNGGGSLRDSFPIFDRAQLACDSITSQGESTGTWAVAKVNMPTVQRALELTAARRPAAENVISEVARVRNIQGPGRAMGMNHDLSSGPTYIPPKEEGYNNEGRGGDETAMA